MLGLGNLLSKGKVLGFPNKYSFNFDGSNDYLDAGTSLGNTLGSNSALTLSVWVKNDNSSQDTGVFKIGGTGTTAGNFTLSYSSGNYYLNLDTNDSNPVTAYAGFANTDTSSWHHILAVYNGTNAIVIYFDGSAQSLSGDGTPPSSIDFTGNNALVGKYYTGEWDGLIDEVAVWNAVLSADDAAKLASKPLNLSKASSYDTDRTSSLKLWLRAGDKVLPEEDTSIARSDFYTDFDGSSDYVVSSSNIGVSGDSSRTVSAWINLNDNPSSGNIYDIISYGAFSTANYFEYGIYNDSGTVKAWANLYGEDTSVAQTFTAGTWYHYTVVFTKSASGQGTLKLYINGSLIQTSGTLGTSNAVNTTDDQLDIGRRNGGSGYFNGAISNLSVYKTALDAQTIKQFAKSRYTPMRDNRFSVVDFDGTDDYVDCGTGLCTSLGDGYDGGLSVSIWFKADVTSGVDDGLFNFSSFGGSSGELFINLNGNNINVRFADAVTSITSFTDIAGWHHLVAVYDGSNNIQYLYLDGVSKDSDANSNTLDLDGLKTIIGGYFNSSYVLNGKISSVAVYNTAKSADEVYAIYQQGITYDESSLSGLVGYWRMGDDTSKAYPTVADSSSNSNDGTITNGASDDIVQQMVAGYDLGSFRGTEVDDTKNAVIDVSNPVLGAEVNPSPDLSSSTGWTVGTRWAVDTSAGTVTYDYVDTGGTSFFYKTGISLDNAKYYKTTITLDSVGGNFAGSGMRHSGGDHTWTQLGISSLGTHILYLKPSSAEIRLWGSHVDVVVSQFSIKEVQGNVGTPTSMDATNFPYTSVLPDQSFLATGVNSAYNFIDLDGSDEYIDCGDGTSLDTTSAMTLSMWFKRDGTSIDRLASRNTNWQLYIYANKITMDYSVSGSQSIAGSTTLSADTWYHVVFTHDGSNQVLYINGSSDVTGSHSGSINNNDVSLFLGRRTTGYFNGKIGQTALWNKGFSATEVSAIYNLGRHENLLDSYSDNLVGYWAMGALDAKTGLSDVGNGTIYDRSGESNHGTATSTESADLKSPPNAEPEGYDIESTTRTTTTP